VKVVVAVWVPDVPVIVTAYCPRLVELLAVSVSMLYESEGFGGGAGFGENDAVTPMGRPEMERATFPLNPY